jgi:N-acetylneuraminic acid mutarotase
VNHVDVPPVPHDELKGYPPPPARWGHTLTKLDNGNILVYGGQSYDVKGDPIILADVHLYDAKKASWDKPINCRGESRQFHSATFIPERNIIIAFGGETLDVLGKGKNKSKVITSDTLRVLDTEIMLWYPPAVSGDIPTGRSGHTATFFPETNELVLFGGVRGSKWLNAVSVLDINRWHWSSPKIDGMPPKPRSYHTATAVGNNKIVVFGGNNKTSCFNTVHVLEATLSSANGDNSSADAAPTCTWKWSNPTVKGKAPFPRTGHTATLLEDGKTICVYGGWDPNDDDEDNIFKGSYLLDTKEWTWAEGPKAESLGSGSPNHFLDDCGPKRCGHQAVLNAEKGEVLVFGGRIPGEALAGDMQRLVPPTEKVVRLED